MVSVTPVPLGATPCLQFAGVGPGERWTRWVGEQEESIRRLTDICGVTARSWYGSRLSGGRAVDVTRKEFAIWGFRAGVGETQ